MVDPLRYGLIMGPVVVRGMHACAHDCDSNCWTQGRTVSAPMATS